MVRTGDTALSYEWRQGCVYSLAAPVILVDGSDAPPSPTDPNVVVAFESGRESLSLRLENFGDGDECDSLCWFRIEEVVTLRRQRARAARRARTSFETRSRRRRQNERGCGQCGFRAVMRQILAKRGIHLTKPRSNQTGRIKVPKRIQRVSGAGGGRSAMVKPRGSMVVESRKRARHTARLLKRCIYRDTQRLGTS